MKAKVEDREVELLSDAELDAVAGGVKNGDTALFQAFLCGAAAASPGGEAKIGHYYCCAC